MVVVRLKFIGGPWHEKDILSTELGWSWDGCTPICVQEPVEFNIADLTQDDVTFKPVRIYSYRRVNLDWGLVLMICDDYSNEFALSLYLCGPCPAPDPAGWRAWDREIDKMRRVGVRQLPPHAHEWEYK